LILDDALLDVYQMKPSMKMDFKQSLLKRGISNETQYENGFQTMPLKKRDSK
jgi:hypothetical protein